MRSVSPCPVNGAARDQLSFSCRSSAQLLMQKRSPVGRGPSSNTWPRWPPQRAQTTSVRVMPCETSSRTSTASATAGSVKLGQPEPESNFVSELNSSAPQPAHLNTPWSLVRAYLPVNGASVACRRNTAYCSGVNSERHSASVFSIFCMSSGPVVVLTRYDRPHGYRGAVPILPFVVATVTALVLAPALRASLAENGFVRENYRGAQLPFPFGVAVFASATVALVPLALVYAAT